MAIRAQSADGAIHEFPDGTDPSVVDRAMKAYAQQSSAEALVPARPAHGVPTGEGQFAPTPDGTSHEPQNAPLLSRVGSAVAGAFQGPYGPSEETLRPLTSGPVPALNALNRAVVGGGGAALDLLARPFVAAVRGGAAALSGGAEATGMADPTQSRKMERDLSLLGDTALLLGGSAPAMPRTPAGTGAAKSLETGQRAAQWLAGVDKDLLPVARDLVNEGHRISPSIARELPTLQRRVEYARLFGWDPTGETATTVMRERAIGLMERMGKSRAEAEQLVEKIAGAHATTMEGAGKALGDAARTTQEQLDSVFTAERAALDREIAEAGRLGRQSGLVRTNLRESAIARAAREKAQSLAHADQMLDDGWRAMDSIIRTEDPQRLAHDFPMRLQEMRRATSQLHEQMYHAADEASGGASVPTVSAGPAIAEFFRDMPQSVAENQPRLIQSLKELTERGEATFGELHWLRNNLRDMGYNSDLTPSFKKGPYAYMARVVDDLIHQAEAHPDWQRAATMLDATDASYARNMAIYRDRAAQKMLHDIEAGVPPDSAAIARTLNTDMQSARRRELLAQVGPQLRDQVWTATVHDMLENARTLGSELAPMGRNTVDSKALLEEVGRLYRNGALADYVGPAEARELVRTAQRLAQRRGTLELDPIGDAGFARALSRAAEADEKLTELAKQEPASMMILEADKAAKRAKEIADRAKSMGAGENPLGMFLEPTRGFSAAAETLLNPDNISALRGLVAHLPEDHPALSLLRQEAFERMIKPFLDVGKDSKDARATNVLGPYKAMSRETQELLFPKITPDALPRLAQELQVIVGNPTGTMPGFSAGAIMSMPVPIRVPIMLWHKAWAALATDPRALKLLLGDLSAGGEAADKARARIKLAVDRAMETEARLGSAMAAHDMRRSGPQQSSEPPSKALVPWYEQGRSPAASPSWARDRRSEAPAAPAAAQLAAAGRNGDTTLAHVSPREMDLLREAGGAGTTNPVTGLPEFYDVGNGPNSGGEMAAATGGDRGSGVMAAGSGAPGALSDPSSVATMGNAGAAMGGAVAGSVAPGGVSAALGGAGGSLGALNAGLGISDQGYRSAGWLADALARITPGRILGGVLTGSLGPVGAGLSLASTASGALGGPTIGSTIDKAIGPPDAGWLDRQIAAAQAAQPALGEDWRTRPVV